MNNKHASEQECSSTRYATLFYILCNTAAVQTFNFIRPLNVLYTIRHHCVSAAGYNQEEPNSDIHERYFWMSPLETDLLHLEIASMKSGFVTGRSSSSLASCLICSGLRPAILRRIDIIDASLKCYNFNLGHGSISYALQL